MFSSQLCAFLIVLSNVFLRACCGLTDVTETVFPNHLNHGTIAAVGDFNSDKQTDLFVLTNQGRHLDILLMGDKHPQYFKKDRRMQLDMNETMTGVVPGDYDGDSQMDILVTTAPGNAMATVVHIFWGTTKSIGPSVTLPVSFTDEPLVMDSNGNMIPDIFGETIDGHRVFCEVLDRNEGNVSCQPLDGHNDTQFLPLRRPHSNAFLDLVGNNHLPDLLLTTRNETSSTFSFEVWENQNEGFTWDGQPLYPPPGVNIAHIGQSAFADIDGNGKQDHLLPVCEDADCHASSVYAYLNNQWSLLLKTAAWDDLTWGFVPPTVSGLPITLRMGDHNLDGYPDALVVIQVKTEKVLARRAALLINSPCENAATCTPGGRTFTVQPISGVLNVTVATFFDLFEKGVLDIVLMSDQGQGKDFQLHALENSFSEDVCFLKIMVLSGLCFADCKSGKPYGVNQPGPLVWYKTTGSDGTTQTSSAAQLSQTAHLALQLPYTVFGLGRTPNFVDELWVEIPAPPGKEARVRRWTSIIPNSQLIIIPQPMDQPEQWLNKLLVTPGQQALLTAGALLGTCMFIAGIVGGLHWKERRSDQKERRQEAHHFHFEAL
ncbi:ITFG1 [Branchiostoma lanceolatum]|uniref:ITFG1 protein n=1 Tax=Branchiostoma lanceolatum TaxID=7740 RepID=A0A8K0A7W8_BRALA|nr:ITFG1 [Branchiostoma lanceolatum]